MADRPTHARLTLFFAVYALGVRQPPVDDPAGAGFTCFCCSRRRRVAIAADAAVVAIAAVCALAGALAVRWNLRTLWLLPDDPPHGVVDALQRFWFDVTKSDWRDTMVMNVPRVDAARSCGDVLVRSAQQFGVAGPCSRSPASRSCARTTGARALMAALFAANVGLRVQLQRRRRPRVLPAVAPARGAARRAGARSRAASVRVGTQRRRSRALLRAMPARAPIATFPALDRSRDDRPAAVARALDRRPRRSPRDPADRPELAGPERPLVLRKREAARDRVARMPTSLLYAPALVADNRAIGREVALTERARATRRPRTGRCCRSRATRGRGAALVGPSRATSARHRYVLCVLRPSRDLPRRRRARRRLRALGRRAGRSARATTPRSQASPAAAGSYRADLPFRRD
jgi:hypothetical protein